MRRADHFEFQIIDFGYSDAHFVLERPHDTIEVEMKIMGKIGDFVIKELAGTVMSTKGITRKKHGIFDQIGKHGIWPVQVGRQEKTQGPATQINLVTITDYLGIEWLVQKLTQKILCRAATVDRQIRAFFKQAAQGSGMVWLGMVDDNQINLVQADRSFNFVEKFIGKRCLNGIDQSDFLLTTNHIRIIGRAVVRREKFIKNFQLGMPDTDPENIVSNLLVLLHRCIAFPFWY